MRTRVPAVALRALGTTDVAAVTSWEAELFGADAWSATAVAGLLTSERHTFVADLDGRVVGYAVLALAGDVADLERIAVGPAHRRSGVATALLDAARTRALQAGVGRLLLEVSEANTGARAFYGAAAAQEIDRRRRYYRDGSDALVLELPPPPLLPNLAVAPSPDPAGGRS